ncbi:YqaE/Pmp3 family membrane protein [Nostoc calcicola FACHB-3891]|nr:YqaE/Pmp3 family membrane protein [Nostoc calcicola FACHB-3891]
MPSILLYILAIFFPPIAISLCGKPIQVFFNVLLIIFSFFCFGFFGFLPCIIHAIIIVSNHLAEQRLTSSDRFRLKRFSLRSGDNRD